MACLSCWHGSSPVLSGFAEPGMPSRYPPSRTARIDHIELWLHLFPKARRFEGEAVIQLTSLPTWDGTLTLDCDEIDVEQVSVEGGGELPWHTLDGTLIIESADCPAAVRVRWTGKNPRHGLYFTGPTEAFPERPHTAWTQCQDEDAHFVLPCHDHPRAKHGWTVHLTGPAGHTLLSNGKRVSTGETNGRAQATFDQKEPMPPYLLTAVSSPLDVIEDTAGDLSVRYLFPRGRAKAAQRSMGRTPEMVALFAERTATAFPWARYDQVVVHDFVFGGMENIGCTTMTELLLVSEDAALEWDPETLVAHELAHQWFGDLVTCVDWSHGWLNESWATYLESVWIDATRPEDEAIWYRYSLARAYFTEADERYVRAIVEDRFREPIDVFDRHLYQKGASVLSTLRHQLGDTAFWAGVHGYLDRHAHGSVHTNDFQTAMEDATGASLGQFFDQWIHTAGHPVIEVTLKQDGDLLLIDAKQTQPEDTTRAVFHVDIRVEIVLADGTSRTTDLPMRERARTFAVPTDGRIAHVRVDPGFRFLGKVTLKGPREWLTVLLSDTCPVLVTRAARALLETGHPLGVDAVVDASRTHPSRFARESLVALIGKRLDPDSEAAVIAVLNDEADPRVRRAAAEVLGGFRTATAADALRSVVSGEPETPHLMGAALKSLGQTRQPGVADVLAKHIDDPSWADLIGSRALAGLAATRDKDVLPHLERAIGPEHPPRLRVAGLGAMASLAAHHPSIKTTVREHIEGVLREGGFRTSLGAIDALKTLGDASAAAILDDVHRSAADGRVMRSAYEAAAALRSDGDAQKVARAAQERAETLARDTAALRTRIERLERHTS